MDGPCREHLLDWLESRLRRRQELHRFLDSLVDEDDHILLALLYPKVQAQSVCRQSEPE